MPGRARHEKRILGTPRRREKRSGRQRGTRMPRRHAQQKVKMRQRKPKLKPVIEDPDIKARWNPKKSVKQVRDERVQIEVVFTFNSAFFQNFEMMGLKTNPNAEDKPAPPPDPIGTLCYLFSRFNFSPRVLQNSKCRLRRKNGISD